MHSVLQFVAAASEEQDENRLPDLCNDHLGWLRDHLGALARSARIPDKQAVLGVLTVNDCAIAERMFGQFFRLWFGQVLSTDSKSGQQITTLAPHPLGEPIRYKEGREWLDNQLGQLWIADHYRLTAQGIERVNVPCLNSVSRCVAYVIALLMENRWGLAARVKACPYRPDRTKGFHVFLDFRFREDGNLMDGRAMKYCCKAHENADAQRRHRQAKARNQK